MQLKRISLIVIASIITSFSSPLVPALVSASQAQVDARTQAQRLLEQSKQQLDRRQYQAVLQSAGQALTLYRQLRDRQGEGRADH